MVKENTMYGNNELQKMYEYQELKGKSGYEYVVRGAEVFCGKGSKTCVLNLPKDHGVYTSDGRPLITVSDTKPGNISGFGICNIDRKHPRTCVPELGSWEVYGNSDMKINGEYAVKRNATVTCKKGGIIILNTSGQTSPSYDKTKIKNTVEIVENVKGRWGNNDYNNDFLGHIKPNNAGLYNFGISFYNNKIVNKPGSIFVYETGGGKLKFIGAYEIKDHTGNEQNKFSEDIINERSNNQSMYTYSTYYWRYWADIALKAGKDYYFEIDCPSREAFDYMLIGNQEKIISNNIGMAKWTMSNTCKDWFVMNVGIFTMKQSIMYLDKAYATILRNLISDYLVRKSINTDWGDIIKEALKTIGITGIGIEDTPMGIALTAWDFIVTNFDKSDIELLWSELDVYVKKRKWETKLIKVLIYEKNSSIALSTGYGVDKRIEVSLWYENNRVVGEKYLWGELTKYDSVGTIEKYTNGEKNVKEGIINQDGFVK